MAENKINHSEFFSFIKKNEIRWNEIYSESKFYYPKILADDLEYYFELVLIPIFEKSKNEIEVEILYKKILELLGKNIIGTSSKFPKFDNSLFNFLELNYQFHFSNFEEFLNSISNLILNLLEEDESQLKKLSSELEKLILEIKSEKEFFIILKVLLWKNGFAFYRNFCLDNVNLLNPSLLSKIFGNQQINLEEKISELKKNPWISLESSIPKKDLIKFQSSILMNGVFQNIPELKLIDEKILVTDFSSTYIIHFDFYSIYFQRLNLDVNFKNQMISLEEINGTGIEFLKKISLNIKSFIKTNHAYFFTLSDSYSIFVYPIC